MQIKESLFDILKLIVRQWKTILRNVAILTLIAIIAVLFLPNYYSSTTVFYPASPDVMKPEHIFGNATKEMEYYGTGVDLDRMLTVAQSGELFDMMIDSFDLYKKYGIDPKGSKARYKAHNIFNDHYSIEKTKLDALELTIEDKDPKQAASMANACRYFINELVSKLLKSNLNELALTIKDNIVKKQKEVNILADSVQMLRNKYKIIDPESQGTEIMQKMVNVETKYKREKERLKILESLPNVPRDTINMLKAMVAGLNEEYKSITDSNTTSAINFNNFNEGRNIIEIMGTQLRSAKDYLTVYNVRYGQVLGVLNGKNNALHLVEKAEIPLVKSRPKRSLIVLSVLIMGLMANVIGIIIRNTLRSPEWKRLWNE
ncbi:MAG: hypothetical protein J5I59_01070 [Saprospiraceae bacterium]|nr:hypothetical protein [Saprospiraceae bacterium]